MLSAHNCCCIAVSGCLLTVICVKYLPLVAEIYAKCKQKELEGTAVQSSQTQYPPSGNVLAGDPLYDEISANNKHVFATQSCPAYTPLPPPRE